MMSEACVICAAMPSSADPEQREGDILPATCLNAATTSVVAITAPITIFAVVSSLLSCSV